VIRQGISEELDEIRKLLYSGKDHLENIKTREIEKTGITSLKIGFNNVFGYYLEVTKAHKDKAPEEWERRQTLVNAERYITDELKTFESKVLGAEDQRAVLEYELFNEIKDEVVKNHTAIKQIAQFFSGCGLSAEPG